MNNVALGNTTASNSTSGDNNVYIGNRSAYSNNGSSNVVIGNISGANGEMYDTHSTYTNSVLIGDGAGYNNVSGIGNVFLGYRAGYNETGSNKLYIANSNTSTPLIYGDFNSKYLKFNANVGINYPVSDFFGLTIGLDANDTYGLVVYGPTYCSSGAWAASDFRFKKNIVTLKSALDKILQLRGVSFEWKTEEFPNKGFTHGENIGLIAQEVEKIIPELVKDGPEGYKSIAYDKLTAFLIEGMKEQQSQIESGKSENAKLTYRVQELESKNTELSTEISKLNEMKSEIEELKTLVNELKSKN